MKIRYITMVLFAILIGLLITRAVTADAEEQLDQVDRFIEEYETHGSHYKYSGSTSADRTVHQTERVTEPETVSLSYEDWKEQQTEPDVYSMDVWTLGSYLYGISDLDTSRTLKIITYEGYYDSPLSYYVACACWARATEGYFGADNLFQAFGGMDPQYDLWMDELGYEEYAVDALRNCYLNPIYITGCNGMEIPDGWIYEEDGIYVW